MHAFTLVYIQFFFAQAENYIFERFKQAFTNVTDSKWVAAGGNTIGKVYGWYPVLLRVADTGLWNISGKTPIQSAELADLYDVLTWLSYDNTKNSIERKYSKL